MIFDVILQNNVAIFSYALEDYEEGPTFVRQYVCHNDDLIKGNWKCPNRTDEMDVPPWALRLAKVLEPRITAMLLTGQPRDLRLWIDDELVETLAKEMEAEDEQAV